VRGDVGDRNDVITCESEEPLALGKGGDLVCGGGVHAGGDEASKTVGAISLPHTDGSVTGVRQPSRGLGTEVEEFIEVVGSNQGDDLIEERPEPSRRNCLRHLD